MIVTIDGPAGAGKSSAARELARRLGFRFLDTGAMYRAVAWAALDRDVDLADPAALAALAAALRVELDGDRVLVDGREVGRQIRTSTITAATHYAADNPAVREILVKWQQAAAQGQDVVTEGRDQATVVFPDAECKIFLTADAEERARRRHRDLAARGEDVSFDDVLARQQVRDDRDASRPVGALRKADDAIEVSTDGLTPNEVVARLEQIARARL